MAMSNTMICGATKIWYYVPENRSSSFEAWLEATRPGYIESLEAGAHFFISILAKIKYLSLLQQCNTMAMIMPNQQL